MNAARSVGVTAFDLFGIFLPGVLLVIALRVVLVPALGPISPSLEAFSYAGWIALGLASYLAGHLVQLVGRLNEQLTSLIIPWGEVFRLSVGRQGQKETATAISRIRDSLEQRTGLALSEISDVVLSNLTDEFLEQFGNASTLASYRSREVYYRGISAAMVILSIAFLICSVWGISSISEPLFERVGYGNELLAFLCLLTALSTGNAYRRQRRRRMRHSLLGYLILETGGRLGAASNGSSRQSNSNF